MPRMTDTTLYVEPTVVHAATEHLKTYVADVIRAYQEGGSMADGPSRGFLSAEIAIGMIWHEISRTFGLLDDGVAIKPRLHLRVTAGERSPVELLKLIALHDAADRDWHLRCVGSSDAGVPPVVYLSTEAAGIGDAHDMIVHLLAEGFQIRDWSFGRPL